MRERRQLPTYALQPSIHRRIFAGFQMGFMAAAIWPIVPVGAATIAGVTFGTLTTIGFCATGWWSSAELTLIIPVSASGSAGFSSSSSGVCLSCAVLLSLLRMLVLISQNAPWYQPTAWTALFANYGVPEPEMGCVLCFDWHSRRRRCRTRCRRTIGCICLVFPLVLHFGQWA